MTWAILVVLAILAVGFFITLANRLHSVSIVFGDDDRQTREPRLLEPELIEPELPEPKPRKQLTRTKARKQLTK
jgi:hypothetical protein